MKRLLALLLVLTVAFCAPAAAETARRPLASGDTGDAVVELQADRRRGDGGAAPSGRRGL